MNRGPLEWLIIAMGLQVLVAIACIGVDAAYHGALNEVYETMRDSDRWLGTGTYSDLALGYSWVKGLAGVLLGVPALALLIMHAYIHNTFLRGSGRQGLWFTPPWTIAWWFIPVANAVMPLLMLQELFRATPTGPEDTQWRASPWSKTITAWWVLSFASAGLELWRHLAIAELERTHETDMALDATLQYINGPLVQSMVINGVVAVAAPFVGVLAMAQLAKRLPR